MDIITQRFIAISNKLLAELRRIGDTLGVLHADSQQQIEAIRKADDAAEKRHQAQPVVRPQTEVPEPTNNEKRKYETEKKWLRRGSIVFAGATLIVIIIYTITSYRQWKQMSCQTKILAQQLAATQKQFRQDERAWMEVVFKPFTAQLGAPIIMQGNFNNTGKTPAVTFNGVFAMEYLKVGQEPFFNYSRGTGHPFIPVTAAMLFPNRPQPVEIPLWVRMPPGVRPTQIVKVTPELTKSVVEGKSYLAVHGRIDYDDIFGGHHWMTFCQATSPLIAINLVSKTCIPYNKIDNN